MKAEWIAVPVVLSIGWLDYVTGPELGLSILYLVPIAATAWFRPRGVAVFVAMLAAVCWITSDALSTSGALAVHFWNGFTRVVIYHAAALLIHRVRAAQEELGAINDRLHLALLRETELARTDTITGLANSRAFLELAERELARARREQRDLAVLYLDLDGFKSVNDRYGHEAGDDVLRRIGETLRHSIRAVDLAARLGGDEFGILLWAAGPAAATEAAARITRGVQAVAADYAQSRLGVSIGVAHAEQTEQGIDELLRKADAAMYKLKTQTGK